MVPVPFTPNNGNGVVPTVKSVCSPHHCDREAYRIRPSVPRTMMPPDTERRGETTQESAVTADGDCRIPVRVVGLLPVQDFLHLFLRQARVRSLGVVVLERRLVDCLTRLGLYISTIVNVPSIDTCFASSPEVSINTTSLSALAVSYGCRCDERSASSMFGFQSVYKPPCSVTVSPPFGAYVHAPRSTRVSVPSAVLPRTQKYRHRSRGC